MKITIHAVLGIKQVIGQRMTEIDLPAQSRVRDLLAYMKETWGKALYFHLFDPTDGSILPHVRIMVNGQTIQYLQGMDTVLEENDEVLFLPPASGG